MPGFATAFEVIAPVRPSGLLAKPGGRHDGRCYCHHVGRLPRLQTGLFSGLLGQLRQLSSAPIKASGIPQSSRIAAHGLLQGGDHKSIDESGLPRILCGRSARWRGLLQPFRDPTSEDQPFQKRVGGQAIGTMHSGGGHFSAGVEAAQVRGAINVGATGIRSVAGLMPAWRQLCQMVGNLTRQVSSPSIRPST